MADIRLMFCLLLVVLIAAPNNRRRRFFSRFQEAERHTCGTPKIALDPLCLIQRAFPHTDEVLAPYTLFGALCQSKTV